MPKKEDFEEIEKRLSNTLNYLREQGINSNGIIKLVNKLLNIQVKDEVKVPLTVFKNDYLSSLETIVKYLRENLLLSFKQIASLTNRNPIALAVTYRNSKKKMEAKLAEETSPYSVPVSILQDRNLSVLENVVSYLKDTFGLTYHNAAVLLNRNDRTIWTVYQRSKKKKK